MKDIEKIISESCEHFAAVPIECVKRLAKAMEQYHNSKSISDEELIKFFAWQNCLTIDETERVVDNYLKQL